MLFYFNISFLKRRAERIEELQIYKKKIKLTGNLFSVH